MKKLKLGVFMLVQIAMSFFALVLITTALMSPLRAQLRVQQETDLERRVEMLESLNLDHRLTVIETLLNDLHSDHWTHLGTMLGTGLLILERGARAIKEKSKE